MDGSSPLREPASPGADFLTPRTKLARMLADIEDEVDNAPTPPPPTRKPATTGSDAPSTEAANDDSSTSPAAHASRDGANAGFVNGLALQTQGDSDPDDESDDDVRRPQGRPARRMHGAGRHSNSVSPSPRSSPPPKRGAPLIGNESEDELYSATPMKPSKFHQMINASSGADEGNGLFVSPAKPRGSGDDSEEELPSNPVGSKERLAELIAQKRAERLQKEAEERRRRKQQKKNSSSSAHASSDLPDEAVEGPGDAPNPDIERIMSDASRPARKASKKALLEMERETQRLARQQALAHQMKVKKKFTTNDLFARFNMRGPNAVVEGSNEVQQQGADSSTSSAPNSDGVEEKPPNLVSTPPSSPPTPFDKQKALVDYGALSKLVPVRQDSIASLAQAEEDNELPDVADMLEASQQRKRTQPAETEPTLPPTKGLKIARLGKQSVRPTAPDSDDDDLEIVSRLPPHLRAFERAQGTTSTRSADSKAIHNLRHLAHLNYDDSKPRLRKGARPSVSHSVLEARLRKQAREQARQQHLERIEELRAKGIEIQTTENREREAEEMEDLLEKARLEAQALRKMERKNAGEEGGIEASDDEDEDFEPELSDEEAEIENGAQRGNGMVDEVAEETDEDEDEEFESSEDEGAGLESVEPENDGQIENSLVESEENEALKDAQPRKARQSRVIADDEDEEDTPQDKHPAVNQTPKATPSQADPFAAFGFGAANGPNGLLSPTQAFNATMQTPTQDTQEDFFDILRRINPPTGSSLPPILPDLDNQTQTESQYNHASDGSQVPESQRIQLNWETQAPETPLPAGMNRGASALSETPTWEPTQDQGLQSPWTLAPKLRRDDTLDSLDDNDTQSTVAMRISESPAPSQHRPKNRGKLTRRQAPVVDSSDDEAEAATSSIRHEKQNAFREMARKRKEALSLAERADADKELRGMMEEQAEESEDEYAGLGGDDFVAPETEADREIIDSSAVDVDERALAAHYAERERERNEAETSRLYKDLTTGVLRRKMGANAFDLEEDEDELAVKRRRLRQQEEARKRKALLKDDNVKTLAEGRQSRGKDAFLKAIADDDGDEEMVGLSDDDEGPVSATATQDESRQSQTQAQGPSQSVLQETTGNKRRLPESNESQERPPAKQRRTAPSASLRRPTSMLEVQESVSFLLDEPQAAAMAGPTVIELSDSEHSDEGEEEHESDHEEDLIAAEEERQNDGGFAPNPLPMEAQARKDSIDMPPPPPRLPANQRRTAAPGGKAAVVDRLSLKRASSTSDSAAGGHGRAAWGASTSSSGFNVPSLLRRATTNSGANERGVTTKSAVARTLSRENSSGVRQGGSKKSSLAYQARVEERKAIVEASARRREENTRRIAALRREGSGAGAAAGGKGWGGAFE